MKRTSLPVIAIALAVPLLAASIQAASADASHAAGKGGQAPAATGRQAPSPKTSLLAPAALTGYRQIISALFTDPAGTQSTGTAVCPGGTKLVGGGALISSTSLAENLNASVPTTDGRTWRVYINNASSADGTFRVYADCVKHVVNYSVVIGTGVDNPSGFQNTATVSCPTGTVPFGGGGFASSGSTQVNLNTSIPFSNGWRADVNNNSTGDNTATAYVACGKRPAGYAQVLGTASTVNGSSQTSASAACPSGRVVFGGGGYSNSGSTVVDLNSSVPSGSGAWLVYENNNTTSPTTITAYAVCGKVS